MLRKGFFLFAVLSLIPSFALSETIDVHIKGVDDGVKTTKQQDYKEAVLFAKREAIERAGVKVKALTTAKDFIVHSDYIESEAEAVLLPGYNIIDVGYQQDGTYLVILIGKVQTKTEGIESKELRYAKTLVEKGDTLKAREIINGILNSSKNSDIVAEAMYCQVLWELSSNDIDTFERLKAFYPNSKYVSWLEPIVAERKTKRESERKREIDRDGHFIAYAAGTVLDTKTGLMWAASDNGEGITWEGARRYCDNYRVGWYDDWRLPTQNELKTLHDPNTLNTTPNTGGCVEWCGGLCKKRISRLFNITCMVLWASESQGSEAGALYIKEFTKHWYNKVIDMPARVLPVRTAR